MKFTLIALVASAGAISLEHRHHHYPVMHAQQRHNVRSRDAYDYDPETTSPYDDMEQHMKWDFGVPRGAPGSKSPFGEHHGSWVDMSGETKPTTVLLTTSLLTSTQMRNCEALHLFW